MLVEFASVVDAVRCVVEIQRGMLERNADIPSEKRIDFRVGINVGDVIVDGDDIYGDGVNVAARLEGLVEPGGILVAGVVRDQVRVAIRRRQPFHESLVAAGRIAERIGARHRPRGRGGRTADLQRTCQCTQRGSDRRPRRCREQQNAPISALELLVSGGPGRTRPQGARRD